MISWLCDRVEAAGSVVIMMGWVAYRCFALSPDNFWQKGFPALLRCAVATLL